jgi:hypothetical protein
MGRRDHIRGGKIMIKRSLPVLLFTFIAFFAFDASAAWVKLCRLRTGVDIYADNAGGAPASKAFQDCIDDETVPALDLQPGTYLVDAPIVVWRTGFRIATAGLAGDIRNCQQLPGSWCARLLASANPAACINDSRECDPLKVSTGGLLQSLKALGVVFDHLIIDGNRAARQGTISAAVCPLEGGNVYGFNAKVDGCHGSPRPEDNRPPCQFTYNLTKNALCGTGLQWSGDHGRVQGNAAYDNGVHNINEKRWADGLTILRNNGGIVSDNHIVNSTDIGLVVGEAAGAKIQSNWIEQPHTYAFAAMMLGNFKETGKMGQSGDYQGALVRYNTINCFGFNCGFGLNLGPDPWTDAGIDYENIFGGTITRNSINGARMPVNFGGAGKYGIPVTVTNNTLTGAPSYPMNLHPARWRCKTPGGVVQNLPRNNREGESGNYGVVDPLATSAIEFKQCWR